MFSVFDDQRMIQALRSVAEHVPFLASLMFWMVLLLSKYTASPPPHQLFQ